MCDQKMNSVVFLLRDAVSVQSYERADSGARLLLQAHFKVIQPEVELWGNSPIICSFATQSFTPLSAPP